MASGRNSSWGRKVGPGIVTGASDDDPSGILTYLQSGVVLGFNSLWTALLTLPLMYGIQTTCGRLGLVTGKGIIRLIRERYSKPVLYLLSFAAIAAIIINIGADLLAMGVVLESMSGWSRLVWIPVLGAGILYGTIFLSYRRIARVLKWLAFSLFFYIATAFYVRLDWTAALSATFFPSVSFSKDAILLVTAILGTTISPYLFFWQATEEIEEKGDPGTKRLASVTVTKHELRFLEEDTFLGMLFSNTAMWFIIAAASQLHSFYAIREIETFDQAALVLRPLLGESAYFIFALGILGTGLLAVPVLAGCVGYAIAEILDLREGMNRTFREARGFYLGIAAATLVGMSLVFSGLDPVTLLIYSGVLYTVITPPLLFVIMRLANDPALMGRNTNSPRLNFLGWAAFALMTAAAGVYVTSLF